MPPSPVVMFLVLEAERGDAAQRANLAAMVGGWNGVRASSTI
jgi:hypothetical protein